MENKPNDMIGATVMNVGCPVCRETVVHPVSLPCGHRFCYLCLKGVFARHGTCPMCRKPIPSELIAKPVTVIASDEGVTTKLDDVQWMYEAKNGGWWLYEKRLSGEIEKAFVAKQSKVEVQISGFMYVVDFEQMVQYRTEKPDRRRTIKRQTSNDQQYKGVAGIPVVNPDKAE